MPDSSLVAVMVGEVRRVVCASPGYLAGRAGPMTRLLTAHEPPPLPVHVVYPAASVANPKLRAFVDIVVPKLRAALAGTRARGKLQARG